MSTSRKMKTRRPSRLPEVPALEESELLEPELMLMLPPLFPPPPPPELEPPPPAMPRCSSHLLSIMYIILYDLVIWVISVAADGNKKTSLG
jgi:hypothetical protein